MRSLVGDRSKRIAAAGWSCLLSMLLAGVPAAHAEDLFFKQTGGPCGGPTGNLAGALDGTLYLLADGVRRSDDNGTLWVELANAPGGLFGLAVDPDGAVYGFRFSQTYRSADGGQTWQQLNAAPTGMNVLFFDHTGQALAGTQSGLYRSADSGSTWTPTAVSGSRIGAIAEGSDGTLYVGAREFLYRSLDQGASWQLFSTLPFLVTAIAERPEGGLYLGVGDGTAHWQAPYGGLFLVDAAGHPSFLGLQDQSVAAILVRENSIVLVAGAGICGDYVCYGPGLFRSADGGVHWALVGSPLSPVLSLASGRDGEMFASTSQLFTDIGAYPAAGVLRASGPGDSWKVANGGMPRATTYCMASGSGSVWAAADQTVFHTEDGGSTWTAAATVPPADWGEQSISYRLAIHPSGDVLTLSFGSLSRSRDQGASWTELDPSVGTSSNGLTVSAAGTLVAVAWGGAWRSSNRGDSWSQIETGWSLPWSLHEQTEIAAGPLGGLAVGSETSTHYSSDDGLTWETISSFRGPVAFSPDETALVVADRTGIKRLVHEGASWTVTELPAGLNDVGAVAVDASGWIYAHDRGGVWRTRAGDPSWTRLSGLDPAYSFLLGWRPSLLIASDGHLYAGTADAGVFRSVAALGTPSDANPDHPEAAWFVGPNPFRSSTTFSFATRQSERVSLAIFDVRGRLVATPLAGRALPLGKHSVAWSASPSTPSGAYFYRLVIGDKTRNGRVLLMR